MRVGDAEREAAAAELQEHFASGRVNQDELNERLAAVFAAKTRGDLSTIFTDLPSSGHGWAGASAPGGRTSGPSGPFGADGPFGPGGPFGAGGPFGHRGAFGLRESFGAGGRGPWTDAVGPDDSDGWQERGGSGRGPGARGIGRFIFTSVLVWALFIVGILGIFGIGSSRPFGVVLIIAAFALLRRLVFIFFGRRGKMRRRSRRR
jgi:hypothetical protein